LNLLGIAAGVVLAGWVTLPGLWTAPDLDQPLCWAFYLCVAVCTPFLFAATRASTLDNFIGQLSYPLYLCHALVIYAVIAMGPANADKGLVAAMATIVVSAVLYLAIDRPIERLRRRISSRPLIAAPRNALA
jgi:peptidoglycan/LPS O-acetylase OafA/YrhL